MFDNHRTLHGRTSFDQNEGKRFLKGCYIDHDSTEGKLRFLERAFTFDLKPSSIFWSTIAGAIVLIKIPSW